MSVLRGLLAAVTVGALTFPVSPPHQNLFRSSTNGGHTRAAASGAGGVAPAATLRYAPNQLEYYLTDAGLNWVRPGLKIKIAGVTNVASGQRPVVELFMTDNMGQPVDRNGIVTPGTISADFVLARWNPDASEYVNLTPLPIGGGVVYPLHDIGGTWTDLETGHAKFTFAKGLPDGITSTQTMTLAIYAGRDLTDVIGKNYAAPASFLDFRPDGGTPGPTFDKVRTGACNSCHDPLAFHTGLAGQKINDVKLCVTCHTSQMPTFSTGETLDFKMLIHKVHMAEHLPSVAGGKPFAPVPGGEDFSTIAYPQDIRNCTTCHEGSDPKNKPTQSQVYMTQPTARSCGSCHDDVNFTSGTNHPGGPATDDTCAKCHQPDSGKDWDASIKAAHTVPTRARQLQGLSATIVSVTNATPGSKPTVVIAVKNANGTPADPTKFTTFSPMFNGPTTSYVGQPVRESGVATGNNPATYDASSGNTTYTFTKPIPATATGTFVFSADIYRTITLTRNDGKTDGVGSWTVPIGKTKTVREAAFNPIKYVAVTGTTVTPRRTVVATANCTTCHDQLLLHGNQRQNTQECVICHNPTATDVAQRPASAGAVEGIAFQRLIHRIHTGEELTQDYTVYGFNGSKNNFNEVRFPGQRVDCAKCHVNNSYTLPLQQTGIGSAQTPRDFFTPQGPATSACLGCHDNSDAAAHAYLNTTQFGGTGTPAEACATCHGTGKDWDVAKVHAQ